MHMADSSVLGVTAPRGYGAAATACAIKEGSSKLDLAVLLSDRPAAAAAVFTRNRVAAAPVVFCRDRLAHPQASAVIVNSGNANACTGTIGLRDVATSAAALANHLKIAESQVLVLSTGVIGVPMPMDRLLDGVRRLDPSPGGGPNFAEAIMTTDTRRKTAVVGLDLEGTRVSLGGAAKGSGMIHPNMATLLGFLTTDAAVEASFLQTALQAAVDVSFNLISVDGDTSTNDAVLLLANGAAGGPLIDAVHPDAPRFAQALRELCVNLARQCARDGEGARTLIEVRVRGAASDADARSLARAVTASTLVKTAVFGADPNWGRVLCAAGYAGVPFDADRATLLLNDIRLFDHGRGAPYAEDQAADALRQPDVTFTLDAGLGEGSAVAWGCDMSYEYVRINAEYTT
jgi:glutamate N-acetyltransferase / amino-acid N-acetyltransferase